MGTRPTSLLADPDLASIGSSRRSSAGAPARRRQTGALALALAMLAGAGLLTLWRLGYLSPRARPISEVSAADRAEAERQADRAEQLVKDGKAQKGAS